MRDVKDMGYTGNGMVPILTIHAALVFETSSR
jgi:hypothetical protein